MTRHFLDLWRLDAATLRAILNEARRRKDARLGWPKGKPDVDAPLAGRTLAMIFQKNSTRTRFSFDAAMRQLGGASTIATASDMQLGRGETIEDTARVLSRMVDAVMIRANRHEDVEAFAAASSAPVINGLTDKSHPCQIMADILTYEERRGSIAGRTLAWVGDGNNVCSSFIHAAAPFGFELVIACPEGFHPNPADLARAKAAGASVRVTGDPRQAARDADAVDAALMALAKPEALFFHDLPAHRGEEVTAEVIDGPQSVIWDEAENRIHAQKAVLAWCLEAL